MSSNANLVKDFTEGYLAIKVPETPRPMNKDDVKFLVRMVFSEMDELVSTVVEENERESFLKTCLEERDVHKGKIPETELSLIAEQADSMVDAWYYMLNIAAKHGMNLSKVFEVVHSANMAKRDPKTGTFIRRPSDGKVIKPEGWQEPNIEKAIERQMIEGSWN